MRAKLFVKGSTEPIDLSEEEAKLAQAFIFDNAKLNDTPFVIEGVWAGRKADMRYVMFSKKDSEDPFGKVDPMSDAEAKEFQKVVEQYGEKAVAEGFKSRHWAHFWMQSQGAIRLEYYHPYGSPEKNCIEVLVRVPKLFKELQYKADTFSMWKGRKEYGEKKRLEGYEETVAGMSV